MSYNQIKLNRKYELFIQKQDKNGIPLPESYIITNPITIKFSINRNIYSGVADMTIDIYNNVGKMIEKGESKNALNMILDYVSSGNKYYDENQPWVKVKEDINSFNDITYTCVYMMANVSNLIYPFMPKSSLKLKEILSLNFPKWEEIKISNEFNLTEIQLLFDKID